MIKRLLLSIGGIFFIFAPFLVSAELQYVENLSITDNYVTGVMNRAAFVQDFPEEDYLFYRLSLFNDDGSGPSFVDISTVMSECPSNQEGFINFSLNIGSSVDGLTQGCSASSGFNATNGNLILDQSGDSFSYYAMSFSELKESATLMYDRDDIEAVAINELISINTIASVANTNNTQNDTSTFSGATSQGTGTASSGASGATSQGTNETLTGASNSGGDSEVQIGSGGASATNGQTGGASATQNSTVTSSGSGASIRLENPLKAGNVEDIPTLIEKLLNIALTIGVPIIALAIIYAGYQFVAAQGNPGKLETAKKTLVYVVIGAIILLGAYVIAESIVGTVNAIRGS